jgi:putative adenylate-forming enzyme
VAAVSVSPIGLLRTFRAFTDARRLGRLASREALQAHQLERLDILRREVMPRSAFYAPYSLDRFESWPVIAKATWMANFDAINTVGIRLDEATRVAEEAEVSRDFRATLRGCAVGFSTGTSGSRGVFVASAAERSRWAGVMLAKLLPRLELKPLRVALLLRANNALYETVGAGPIRFGFFDLTRPFLGVLRALEEFEPTILVAPSHVLSAVVREAREKNIAIHPRRVISVAEVLDTIDRKAVEQGFGVRVEQIYQATEGFLGSTCGQGTLHLNEEYVLFEREWLDSSRTRFVPVITDLYRTSQPVIRYRLNDVLVPRSAPCPCGSPLLALERIEGREDDVLWLPSSRGPDAVPVFGDVISRVLVRTLPGLQDYSVDEIERGRWRVGLAPSLDQAGLLRVREAIAATAAALGASPPNVEITEPRVPQAFKHRRIRGARSACLPS